MNIMDYFNIVWRRKYIVLLTLIAAIIAVGIGTSLETPLYEASAVLRIATSAGGPIEYSVSTSYTTQLLNTTSEIATSKPILEELSQRLGLNQLPDITSEVILNTELIKITVTSEDPEMAAQAANTLVDILIEKSNQLYYGGSASFLKILEEQLAQSQADFSQMQQDYAKLLIQTPPAPDKIETVFQLLEIRRRNYEKLLGQYQESLVMQEIQSSIMTVANPADVPDSPSSPRLLWNYGLGLIIGLVGGLLLAFVVESVDNTLPTTVAIEQASQLTSLAQIPKVNGNQLYIHQNKESSLVEVFRMLGMQIVHLNQQRGLQVILISSAEPKQGKSMVASNLAYSLSELGKRVVLIDGDMHIPTLHAIFNLNNEMGLSDILDKNVAPKKVLQKISGNDAFQVLTSGPIPENASQLIGLPEMGKLVDGLKNQFDFILLDTPALLAVSDAAAIAQSGDGFLWVVRRMHSKREAVQKANRFLQDFADKFIGLIVNQAENTVDHYQYYRKKS